MVDLERAEAEADRDTVDAQGSRPILLGQQQTAAAPSTAFGHVQPPTEALSGLFAALQATDATGPEDLLDILCGLFVPRYLATQSLPPPLAVTGWLLRLIAFHTDGTVADLALANLRELVKFKQDWAAGAVCQGGLTQELLNSFWAYAGAIWLLEQRGEKRSLDTANGTTAAAAAAATAAAAAAASAAATTDSDSDNDSDDDGDTKAVARDTSNTDYYRVSQAMFNTNYIPLLDALALCLGEGWHDLTPVQLQDLTVALLATRLDSCYEKIPRADAVHASIVRAIAALPEDSWADGTAIKQIIDKLSAVAGKTNVIAICVVVILTSCI
jgi:hypothetical protein